MPTTSTHPRVRQRNEPAGERHTVLGADLFAIGDGARSSQPALAHRAGTISYGELADLIDERVAAFDRAGLPERSVVVLTGDNDVEWVVSYLALLARRDVPLLASDHVDRLVERWSPAATLRVGADEWRLDVRFDVGDENPSTSIHPELGLLMSTSGSTGNPKLVRLSTDNLVANAASIAEFQGITTDDVGITSLPLHYSFGLSVLHSHLIAGASVVVTSTSVVDPCFRALLLDHGVTNLAGVPHTYDLIDRAGPEQIRVPTLRFLAQAGGRMAPDKIAAWSARAGRWHAQWFSMYGQTEATARMTYVPPTAVRSNPDAIGIAIPGGTLEIRPTDQVDAQPGPTDDPRGSVTDDAVGEIVYRGPNVMLGYATEPADLALGRTISELRTGDLGRVDPESGFVRVVGRLARRVKPFGFRIDLDDVERRLADAGVEAVVAGDDDLVVAAAPRTDPSRTVELVAAATGLPSNRIVAFDRTAPRTSNGKLDYPTLLRDAHDAIPTAPGDPSIGNGDPTDRGAAVRATLMAVLGVDAITDDDTFVGLGGDSLSYIECSIRLERALGSLPTDWHLRPVRELAAERAPRRLARVDTTVVLRAVGILAVVSTHMRLWHVPGGSHLLLGVVGYNLARFTMPIADTQARLRSGFRTVLRVAVPTVLWTLAFMAVGQYTWHTLTLVNNYIGPRSHAGNHWHFWFIEVFVHVVVLTLLVTAIPAVRRLDLRFPYAFPLALLGGVLTLRMDWADMGDWYNLRFRTHAVAWFFVLGWLVQRSTRRHQQVATSLIALVTAYGVFQNPQREYFIATGLVLLVWVKEIPLPRPAVAPIATVAAASMWILISHFMIWPPMKDWFIVEVAYPLTVLASIGVWWTFTHGPRLVRERLASTVRSRPVAADHRPATSLV